MLNTYVPIQTMSGLIVLFFSAIFQTNSKPFISSYLNLLEIASISASVMTLLAGQVFYTEIDNEVAMNIITYTVIFILLMNVCFVTLVIYLDWKPIEDSGAEFAKAEGEAFETVTISIAASNTCTMTGADMMDNPDDTVGMEMTTMQTLKL